MKKSTIVLGLLLALRAPGDVRAAEPTAPLTLNLWPGTPPGETAAVEKDVLITKPGQTAVTRVDYVKTPILEVFRPDAQKNTGTAVVICPGGGYTRLSWEHEGVDVARWLNSLGVTGIVLRYRVPRRADTPKDRPPIQALMDAQRALSLVHSKAEDWGIDAKRIGILGFSAGGHLSAWASTNFDKRAYEPVDDADKLECRPAFAALIYPGAIVKSGTDQFTPEIRVTSQTPPMFFAHATNDPVPSENSVYLYLALKQAKIPCELHLYAEGGHGFGMRPSKLPIAAWPQRCEDWLRSQGLLKPSA